MAIEGSLRELSIEDVLQLLSLADKTGVLMIRSDRLNDEAIVHFSNGDVVFAVRRRSTRRIGQLLVRVGKVTERELNAALEIQRTEPNRRVGETLIEIGAIARDVIERQLRFQIEETMHELLAWKDGHFEFEERTDIAKQPAVRIESLLMEGARRHDEWTRFEATVPGPESVPVLARADPTEARPLELDVNQWELLGEIDGERDIGRLAADMGRSAFDVANTAHGLVNDGIAEVRDRRSRFVEELLSRRIVEVDRLRGEGRIDEARRLARELEASYPDRAELALLTARTLAAQSRLRAAVEAFSRAAGLDPLSPDTHYQLGVTALRTGDFERAAKAWDTYVRLSANGEQRDKVVTALSAVRTITQFLHGATSLE